MRNSKYFRDKGLFCNLEEVERYNRYKLIDDEEGYYIVPDDGAILQSSKNAFDSYPEIIIDFIDLAKRIENEKEEDGALRILKFCNKYGLFNISGLYMQDFGDSYFVDEDYGDGHTYNPYHWVLLSQVGIDAMGHDVNLEGGAVVNLDYFADIMIPKSWEKQRELFDDKDNLPIVLFENNMCEPIKYLRSEILDLYSRLEYWLNLASNEKVLIEKKNNISSSLESNPVMVSVDYNKSWKIKWIYKSLIDAINIMFLVKIVETNQKVLFCNNCGDPFITKKDEHYYCSTTCNNAARQRRWYDKHQKKNQKD